MHDRQPRESRTAPAALVLCALAGLAFGSSGFAQPGEPAAQGAGPAAPPSATQAGGGAAQPAATRAPPTEAQLEAAVAAGLKPVATYIVEDEITVTAVRPGDIRGRLWDLDTEIESTIVSFYDMLNEVIVDPQYHVYCVRDKPQPFSRGTRLIQRRCYSGFQIDELEAMQPFATGSAEDTGEPAAFAIRGDAPAGASAAGVAGPNDQWLSSKEQEYAALVMEAIATIPALAVAAEDLVLMHTERESLTGGRPALTPAQYERDLARRNQQAQFEMLARRRERKAEREAEREAERAAEREEREAVRP